MLKRSSSALPQTLLTSLDSVVNADAPPTMTSDHGHLEAVLISPHDCAPQGETRYLLSNPANAARLMASIAKLEGGRGTVRE